MENEHLFVRATIQGHPVRLLLDTGASHTAVSPQFAKAAGLDKGSEVQFGTFGNRRGSAWVTSASSLQVGQASASNAPVLVMPIPAAFRSDGFLGLSFLKLLQVRIDYENLRLTLNPSTSEPGKGITWLPMETHARIVVPIEVDGVAASLFVDTGAGQEIILHSWFIDRQGFRNRHPHRLNVTTGQDIVGIMRGDIALLSFINCGGIRLTNVWAEFRSDSLNQQEVAGYLGAGLLSRFHVTFDFQGGRLGLEPNSLIRSPRNLPACARTGMMYLPDGVISDTLPGSPADQAGIRIGDRLLSVNGDLLRTRRSIREISPFSGLPGTRVKVEVQTGSQPPRTCTITLRDLIQ